MLGFIPRGPVIVSWDVKTSPMSFTHNRMYQFVNVDPFGSGLGSELVPDEPVSSGLRH